jgi:hypothetical protein
MCAVTVRRTTVRGDKQDGIISIVCIRLQGVLFCKKYYSMVCMSTQISTQINRKFKSDQIQCEWNIRFVQVKSTLEILKFDIWEWSVYL